MRRHRECDRDASRPRYEVADVFRSHGEAYRANHVLTSVQYKAMRAIESCRTAVLGGHVDQCLDCGYERPSYNSCCNRHCPKCQSLAQNKWLEKRMQRVLPVHYFHAVFTLPHVLLPLARLNPQLIYSLLLRCAGQTLVALGRDPKRLGALLGVTAVLHTWTRDLRLHPHAHCIVTGGGLAHDGLKWIDTKQNHLFPVKVLGRLFRGKFVAGLTGLLSRGELVLPHSADASTFLGSLKRPLFKKNWVVYVKRPFAGPELLFAYLGRYTHRVGISNHRLLNVTDDAVTINTRGDDTVTMTPQSFIERFLLHILPSGFTKIRHYGLMASSNAAKLELARRLLLELPSVSKPALPENRQNETDDDWRIRMLLLTGIDLRRCPACSGYCLVRRPLKTHYHPRAPPQRKELSP